MLGFSTLKPKLLLAGFYLVLLIVPYLLTGCRGRTVLGTGDPKRGEKSVVGFLAQNNSNGSATSSGAASVSPDASGLTNADVVTIWFTRAGDDRLNYVPEVRKSSVRFKDSVQAVSFALTELLVGPGCGSRDLSTETPSKLELSSEIPRGTVLIGVNADRDSGDITVNLSRRFVQAGGMDSFEARLEQVKRTVEGVVAAKPVYLNIEGTRLMASGDGLEVKQPINGEVDVNANANSN